MTTRRDLLLAFVASLAVSCGVSRAPESSIGGLSLDEFREAVLEPQIALAAEQFDNRAEEGCSRNEFDDAKFRASTN